MNKKPKVTKEGIKNTIDMLLGAFDSEFKEILQFIEKSSRKGGDLYE